MIRKIFSSLFVLIFFIGILPVNVLAQEERIVEEEKPIEEAFTPTEIVSMRTETGKTTQIGNNSFSLDSSIGAIHYKDNYSNNSEQWKDIDLTPTVAKDGSISVTKAPYELTIKGLEVFVKDKKTGATTTLTLSDVGEGTSSSKVSTPVLDTSIKGLATAKNIATDTDLEISWENSRIKYTRILKSSSAPITAKYSIEETGTTKISITAQAEDSKTEFDKSVEVISEIKDGVLTETIDSKESIIYPMRIDPTLDISVSRSRDDAGYDHSALSTINSNVLFGQSATTVYDSGFRFTGVTIPYSSFVTNAYVHGHSADAYTADTVRIKIYAEQSSSPLTFSTLTNYLARGYTTASIDWDFTTNWTYNVGYNTDNISTIIQELVDDYGGLLYSNIAIFLNDDGSDAGAFRSYRSNDDGSSPVLHVEYTESTCSVTGTILTATDSNIVSGGKTIILTLTDDTWVADGATFNAQRQNIIDGISSTIGIYPNTGGTITDNGTHKFHRFTNDDAFYSYENATVQVEAWGGGGGGGYYSTYGGGGGGGGAYAATPNVSVTANTAYTCSIGVGGPRDTAGAAGSSTFATTTVVAKGGTGVNSNTGGAGGAATGTGTTQYAGGAGKNSHTTSDVGGGGGGAAGPDGVGLDGVAAAANAHGDGGAGDNGSGGAGGTTGGANGADNAKGGGGGAGSGDTDGQTGGNGGSPGGGGGGTDSTNLDYGWGSSGQVIVTCLMTDFVPTGTTTHAWDAEVRANIPVTDVVRTSSTIVTITLSAQSGYAISENETMMITIPSTSVSSGKTIKASPNFTVAYSSAPTYDITNDPSTKAFGTVAESSTYYAKGTAPNNPVVDGDCTYTLTNTGSAAITVNIHGHNFTGGTGWTLGSSVGSNQVKITAYRSGIDPASGVVLTTSDQELVHEIAASAHTHWDFKFETGTFTDGAAKSGIITLSSVAH